MRFILKYLKAHRKSIGLFGIFIILFILVFALYRLPIQAVGYAFILCFFFGSIIVVPDYISSYRKHIRLQMLTGESFMITENLPQPDSYLEQDYQELIWQMHNLQKQLTGEMTKKHEDLAEYFTIWVHQIKTPIAAMRLLLQDEDATRQNQELQDELQRIEQYVEMVLTYLRLASDSTDYLFKKYDLDKIIKRAIKKYSSQFIRKKIRLDYQSLDYQVLTDEKWLLFVLEQLLSNALKYTPAGTISITLNAPGLLCIRDTGYGIASEDIARIFENGYTGYNGRRDRKSSGIGLYLCRRILKQLGHPITITSEIGKGTAVFIDLNKKQLEID